MKKIDCFESEARGDPSRVTSVVFKHLLCLCQVSVQIIGNSQSKPILSEIRAKTEKCVPGFHELIKMPELSLEVGSISENVKVFLYLLS